MPKPIIILAVLSFALTALTGTQNKPATDFQTKVDSFIKAHSADFSVVPETFISGGNDFVLDKKVTASKKEILTLKHHPAFKNESGQTVYPRFYLGFYQYENKRQCSAALDSLLNCFGTDCSKLKWGENGKYVKTTPVLYLINEKEIVVCRTRCEYVNDLWISFKHDLAMTLGNGASVIIDTGCGGPVNFRKF